MQNYHRQLSVIRLMRNIIDKNISSSKMLLAIGLFHIILHDLTNHLFFFIVAVSLTISSLGTPIILGMPRELGQEHLDIRMGMCKPRALRSFGRSQLPLLLTYSLTMTRALRYVFHSDLVNIGFFLPASLFMGGSCRIL